MPSGTGTFHPAFPEPFFISPDAPAVRPDRRANRYQLKLTWCKKLRELIAETGKPQWQVAQDMNIAPAQLSHILNRYRTPTPEQLITIATYFNVDPKDLI